MERNDKNQTVRKLNFSIDYKLVIIALLVVIAAMLAIWRPWTGASDRTIEVTGQSTVTGVPDEFVFYPVYEFKNVNKQAALDALTKKSNELITKLKELGLSDGAIKTNSDGYDYPLYSEQDKTPTYALRLTITANSKDLAQKIQDYLLTTSPSGAVSPQAGFSDTTRNSLESKARDEATKDARAKAEQSAKNLGFSVGAVKSVVDGAGFGIALPARDLQTTSDQEESLAIQPGENELTYSVSVVYFVR